jgi:hypothetical protein
MATATKTKAQLEAQVAELQAALDTREPEQPPVESLASFAAFEQLESELEAALARIKELESHQRDQFQSGNTLSQVLWLQRTPPTGDKRGFTPGGTKFLRFGAQYSRLDEQSGERLYGAWKSMIAYGATAEAIAAFFEGTDRLVRIVAFEKPWHGRPAEEGQYPTRNSEWIVKEFSPMPRVDAPATAVQTAASAPAPLEPTSEEIPF